MIFHIDFKQFQLVPSKKLCPKPKNTLVITVCGGGGGFKCKNKGQKKINKSHIKF